MADNQVTDPQPAPDPGVAQRPDFLPEKFWDPEANAPRTEEILKSYDEMQKKLTTMGQTQTTAPPTAAPATGTVGLSTPAEEPAEGISEESGIEQILEAAKLDPVEVGRTWAEKGELTPEMYKALKDTHGKVVTKRVVNDVIGALGQSARMASDNLKAKAAAMVGGEKQRENLTAWIQANFSKQDLAMYNEDMYDVHDEARCMRAFEWAVNKHREAVGAGKTAPLLEGAAATPTGGGFTSQDEMVKAIRDPRYRNDPAYANQVNVRLGATDEKTRRGMR